MQVIIKILTFHIERNSHHNLSKGILSEAIVCNSYGSPDVLQLKEVKKTSLKDD
ncbi:MAG: hypothetical protein JSW33_14370 [bacterium]|nr:MAG: hypothetical protein JSW33_14370 [bacterium]